jgi:hypothetical protein
MVTGATTEPLHRRHAPGRGRRAPTRQRPRQAVLFSINMLVGTPSGRSYRESEYAWWMGAAGLAGFERVRLPGPAHLVIGGKPRG